LTACSVTTTLRSSMTVIGPRPFSADTIIFFYKATRSEGGQENERWVFVYFLSFYWQLFFNPAAPVLYWRPSSFQGWRGGHLQLECNAEKHHSLLTQGNILIWGSNLCNHPPRLKQFWNFWIAWRTPSAKHRQHLWSLRMTWHVTITSITSLPQHSQLVIRYSWMLPTFTQHALQRSYRIISSVPSQLFIQLDCMPITCDSHPLCCTSTLSSMLSSSCWSQKIQSDDKFAHHLHQLWLEVNNIMRWSLFQIAGSGLGSWSSWWTGRAMGMRRTLGWEMWHQCTVTNFPVLSWSPWCTSSHSYDSLCQHELPCWFTNTMILP